jgi:hypothetical protein
MLTAEGIGAVWIESRGGNYTAEKSKLRLVKNALVYGAGAGNIFLPLLRNAL